MPSPSNSEGHTTFLQGPYPGKSFQSPTCFGFSNCRLAARAAPYAPHSRFVPRTVIQSSLKNDCSIIFVRSVRPGIEASPSMTMYLTSRTASLNSPTLYDRFGISEARFEVFGAGHRTMKSWLAVKAGLAGLEISGAVMTSMNLETASRIGLKWVVWLWQTGR